MKLRFRRFDLKLAHEWTVSSRVATGGKHVSPVVFVELRSADGGAGLGEAAPSVRYQETVDTVLAFLARVDPRQLSFHDVPASVRYLATLAPAQHAAKTALEVALVDGAARRAGQPVHDWLRLGFPEGRPVTSFSIGIDRPEVIRQKVAAASAYPILKFKVGGPGDAENLAALRDVAPTKRVRVDANEAWATKEEALRQIERLAGDGHLEFVEQPMPASADRRDLAWLRARSPLPVFADESYRDAADAAWCAECFHGVNVKLVKHGGITGAQAALTAARAAGLRTMIGCMIESSLLISAAAHLAALADHLDLDGNLLVTNDPFAGVTAENGVLSFAQATETLGLRVGARPGAEFGF